MDELLILVDENNNELGVMDKMSVHKKGLLHRAFSVFLFNSHGQLLLQKRSAKKYHSAGLWSNSCCSHPRFGEEVREAIQRRLGEELGIKSDPEFVFSFIYKTQFDNGLIEHELDHVYFSHSDQEPRPDKDEVESWRYIDLKDLENEIMANPDNFTFWLKKCLPAITRSLHNKLKKAVVANYEA